MEILRTEDRSKISKVIFKFPELMGDLDKMEQIIKDEYNKIQELKASIAEARLNLWKQEEELEKRKKKFHEKSSLFELKFEIKEKEYHVEKCSIMLKGHGNDIIGVTNVM